MEALADEVFGEEVVVFPVSGEEDFFMGIKLLLNLNEGI